MNKYQSIITYGNGRELRVYVRADSHHEAIRAAIRKGHRHGLCGIGITVVAYPCVWSDFCEWMEAAYAALAVAWANRKRRIMARIY